MARAFGSYPTGRWFKSTCRYQQRLVHRERGILFFAGFLAKAVFGGIAQLVRAHASHA